MRNNWGKSSGASEINYGKKHSGAGNKNLKESPQVNFKPQQKPLVSLKTKSQAPPTIAINTEAIKNLRPEMMVEHEKFGVGKVLKVEGDFPDLKATIHFGNAGQKMLLLKFARLKVLG